MELGKHTLTISQQTTAKQLFQNNCPASIVKLLMSLLANSQLTDDLLQVVQHTVQLTALLTKRKRGNPN